MRNIEHRTIYRVDKNIRPYYHQHMKKNILHLCLSLLSGLLLVFSFPNFIENTAKVHTSFFAWFAFVPVMYVVIKEEKV